MIVIDTPNNGWCHLVATNINELHGFAQSIGIKRCWFQNKRGKQQPHYDLRSANLPKALDAGAIKVNRKTLFQILNQYYA